MIEGRMYQKMMHPPFVFKSSCVKFAVKVSCDGKIEGFIYKGIRL